MIFALVLMFAVGIPLLLIEGVAVVGLAGGAFFLLDMIVGALIVGAGAFLI